MGLFCGGEAFEKLEMKSDKSFSMFSVLRHRRLSYHVRHWLPVDCIAATNLFLGLFKILCEAMSHY
jgi:hypothetical protein